MLINWRRKSYFGVLFDRVEEVVHGGLLVRCVETPHGGTDTENLESRADDVLANGPHWRRTRRLRRHGTSTGC